MTTTTKPTPFDRARDEVLDVVADNVRARREKLSLTRRDLAQKSGVHEDVLQKIELRQRLPMTETLLHVAMALDCTVGDLFRKDGGG